MPKSKSNESTMEHAELSRQAANIPNQIPGLQYKTTVELKIGIDELGHLTNSDQAFISNLRAVLSEVVEELITKTEGSNTLKPVHDIAKLYANSLAAENVSIDLLYGRGMRLENFRFRYYSTLDSDEGPVCSTEVLEALDSFVALNGTVISSTKRGRLLLKRADEYRRKLAESEKFNSLARVLTQEIESEKQLFAKDVREEFAKVVAEAGRGDFPNRAYDYSEAATQNLLAFLSKVLMTYGAGVLVASTPGKAAVASLVPFVDLVWMFLKNNADLIMSVVAVGGQSFQYLTAVLSVIEKFGSAKLFYDVFPKVIEPEPDNEYAVEADAESEFDYQSAVNIILSGDEIPDRWVPMITRLRLVGNGQKHDLKNFAKLKNLKALAIHGLSIDDLDPLAHLHQLNELVIPNLQVPSLNPISNLGALTNLKIDCIGLSDLDVVGELLELRRLWLSNIAGIDLKPLSKLHMLYDFSVVSGLGFPISFLENNPGLCKLSVTQVYISDLESILNFHNLYKLRLDNVGIRKFDYLSELTSLKNLNIARNQIRNIDSIANLQRLEYLDVSGCPIADLSCLKELPKLKAVRIESKTASNLEAVRIGMNFRVTYT